MVNEYKKIVLLKGFEAISDYHFNTIKSLLASDLKLTKKMQDDYDRIKIADLMEKKFPGPTCVDKLIELLKDIPSLKDIVETLRKQKSKVTRKIKTTGKTPVKKNKHEDAGPATPAPMTSRALESEKVEETAVGQKRKSTTKEKTGAKRERVSQEQGQPPSPSEASMSTTTGQAPPPQIPSTPSSTSLNENQEPQAQRQRAARRNVLQKGPMIVMVLKATEPFKYESPEKGKSTMFHATVATENKFFYMKIFNTNLKEKFTPKKVIILSNYFECKGLLEVDEASSVSEAGPDLKIVVPKSIIKRANETPKIDNLLKQASGTLVYGLFLLHKKTVNRKNTIYEIQDNTGKMDIMGNGKWHNIVCEEGDKLRLFCFQLRTIDKTLKLTCGIHSFMKVIKAKKIKKELVDSNFTNVNYNDFVQVEIPF
ncbi:myeloid cell nuclear differentiation antigen [Dasypus novemcinctus]|uniref:myeloid cell nuclear differentiation antigen n=1 Tax=Dasypus novemcinctus TaxID=9361 RepID=UPI0003290706|nr:myeloid cell nuclear differentiation antigen [Dasypus novemcinctus]XP_058165916.1 myeloid cell nuclear differentiation antigen [Dasypus novemcinctus]XP_058165917.1 myeloid cell nuclear differentiation antigen [Dasypus novemcinctus]